MKAHLILFLGLLLTPPAWSRVTIRCDFADPAMMGKPMEYHWDIYNRISPMRNCNPTGNPNGGICVVRPLGGNSAGGRMLIDEDTYHANPKSQGTEPMTFKITLPEPGGKKVTYRVGSYQKEGDRLVWSDWTQAQTTAPATGSRSELVLTADLPVFSFLKYEIVTDK